MDTLYEVIKSKKRSHTVSEQLIEQIMYKYLGKNSMFIVGIEDRP